jgi:SNF2 family DNA or RNA helicase
MSYANLGFVPRAEKGCVGPPSTCLPENAPEHLWTKGSIPDQPVEVTRKLFPHQLKSVADMEQFERKKTVTLHSDCPNPTSSFWTSGSTLGLNMSNMHDLIPDRANQRYLKRECGVQADPVGYGKTLSVVALIARDKMAWDMTTQMTIDTVERCGWYESGYTNVKKRVNATLIIASLSCVDQWIADFKFAPCLKILVVKSKKTVETLCSPVTRQEFDYDVVLCTPNFYRMVVQKNPNVAWKRFVFDEPAHVKIPRMQSPLCGYAWFITATPGGVVKCQHQNWVGKLFDRMSGDSVSRYYGGGNQGLMLFTVRNPDSFVQQSFGMPHSIMLEYLCSQPLASGLRGIVSADVLAQIEAGDISGAISALGGSSASKDTIIDVIRAKKTRRRDEILFHLNRATADEMKTRWKDRLVAIDDDLSQLEETLEDDLQGSCMICLDDLFEPVMEPACGKMFCGGCMLRWITAHSNNCPNCRVAVDPSCLVHVGAPPPEKQGRKTHPTKLECMEKIFKDRIAEDPRAKFVLASQFKGGYFGAIQACLERLGIKFCKLKGASSSRTKMIKSFQEGDTQVVFLTNLANTAGVNLQAATDVIMFNSMDESTRTQVIGRANRIGRTKPVFVHTLKVAE